MKYKILILFFMCAFSFPEAMTQKKAFPGAEGGGKYTSGGRGGKVLFVDNLNDKGNGSFRKAIEAEGPRTIIFRVSGNIELNKTIHIKHGDLTIAGQTAPGDGICLANYGVRVDADNVIIRYIRIRPGDKMKTENDAFTCLRNKNIIIDHCSFSWANDEVASCYDNENFSMQWCIISESMYKSAHHKGEHGYGGIWGGLNASFHHNLISDHSSRNPRLCGSRYTDDSNTERTDLRNNVIYNWGNNSIYGGEEGNYNIVNNYFKAGPATKEKARFRILQLTQEFYDQRHNKDTLRAGWFFISGNEVEGNPHILSDNWKQGVQGSNINEANKEQSMLTEPVAHTAIQTSDASTAYRQVLKYAGANLHRDLVDMRIIKETKTGKESLGASYRGGGKGLIDSQNDVGAWPKLKSEPPQKDSDNDGMPDSWEKKHQLDPNSPDDALYSISKEYTNLEFYINSLVKKKIKKY